MKPQLVTVIGGTGFIGRYVVQELVKSGYNVQVISRKAHRGANLQPLGYQNKVIYRRGDITNPRTMQEYLAGSFAVINLVGILFEKRKQRFSAIHAQCPERLAKVSKEMGVQHFVHISALGADKAVQSVYARSKGTGEKAVMAAFPLATIFRPSVVFGAEDNFFNQFACMSRFSPFLPLIGGGKTLFQPAYVVDVAKAIVASLSRKETQGKIYELGGSSTYSFRELMEFVVKTTGNKARLLTIPFPLAKMIGFLGEWMPRPILTRDQVKLLQHDNLVQPERDGFTALTIKPTALEMVVPAYLQRFSRNPSSEQIVTTDPMKSAA
jgi:uncharacterized protein YbjT (DUF2867 family)